LHDDPEKKEKILKYMKESLALLVQKYEFYYRNPFSVVGDISKDYKEFQGGFYFLRTFKNFKEAWPP